MHFTILRLVILLVAIDVTLACFNYRSPHIVLDKPHTEFDTGQASIKVKARKGGVKLRCAMSKSETKLAADIKEYRWERNVGQIRSIDATSNEDMIVGGEDHQFEIYTCTIVPKCDPGKTSTSAQLTISFVEGGPPLGSHPEVSDYTSTSVDVSWKKPTTKDTITDYDIKISPIYSKETASAVKGDVENPKTHLTNLSPRTSYEVTVRTHTLLDGDDYYGPEKKQSFMTKDAANQKERSLVSIVTCFILSLSVSF